MGRLRSNLLLDTGIVVAVLALAGLWTLVAWKVQQSHDERLALAWVLFDVGGLALGLRAARRPRGD